jgi:hypothetical protein
VKDGGKHSAWQNKKIVTELLMELFMYSTWQQ